MANTTKVTETTPEAVVPDAAPEEVAPDTTDYIEFLGEEPYGTAFLTSHTIPKGDGLWKRNKIESPKAIVWERDPMGPAIGHKGSRMLVRVDDIDPAQVALLEKTPGYKRVTE